MKCIFKKIWQNKWSYVLAAVFSILSIIQGYIALSGSIYSSQVNGSIMCACLMLLTWQMIITQGRWFWVCILGSLGQMFQVGLAVFVFEDKAAMPGFTISCFVLIYQIIIYHYLRIQLRDRRNLEKIDIIINIAHLLSCEVVAEGVETEDQLRYLRDHGCDIIQGYYYSKPLPLESAITII